jgi:hypothetical protein
MLTANQTRRFPLDQLENGELDFGGMGGEMKSGRGSK